MIYQTNAKLLTTLSEANWLLKHFNSDKKALRQLILGIHFLQSLPYLFLFIGALQRL